MDFPQHIRERSSIMSPILGGVGCLRQNADIVDVRVGLGGLKQNADCDDSGNWRDN